MPPAAPPGSTPPVVHPAFPFSSGPMTPQAIPVLATAATVQRISSPSVLPFSAFFEMLIPPLLLLPFLGVSNSDDDPALIPPPSAAPSSFRLARRSFASPPSSALAVTKTSTSGTVTPPGLVSTPGGAELCWTGRSPTLTSGDDDVSSDVEPFGGRVRAKVGFSGSEAEWGGTDRATGSGGGHGAVATSWSEQLPLVVDTPAAGTASPVDVAGFAEGSVEDRTNVSFSTPAAATANAGGVELGNVGERAALKGEVPFRVAGGHAVPGGTTPVAVVEEEAPDSVSIPAQQTKNSARSSSRLAVLSRCSSLPLFGSSALLSEGDLLEVEGEEED